MIVRLKILPLAQHVVVGFHLRHGLGPFEPIAVVLLDEVVEDERIGSLAPIFRQHTDEQHVDRVGVMPFDGVEHSNPSEGQQFAVLQLALRLRERGEGDAETHHLIVQVAVYDDAHQVEVGYADILVYELIHLALAQRGKAVEVAVADVEHLEHLAPVALFQEFLARELVHLQVIAAAYHLGNLSELLGNALGHLHLALHPVVVFLETAYLLHVTGIVVVVIVGVGGGIFAESLDEHAFAVGIGKAHRTNHLVHAPLASPLGNGVEQRLRHLDIVDEIEPSEAHALGLPTLVGLAVDDGSHAPHGLSVAVGHEIVGLAVVERSVLVVAQRKFLVTVEIRHIVRVVTVKIISELDKIAQSLQILYFLNCNHSLFKLFAQSLISLR